MFARSSLFVFSFLIMHGQAATAKPAHNTWSEKLDSSYFETFKNPVSVQKYLHLWEIADFHDTLKSKYFNVLGIAHALQMQNDSAIVYFQKSLSYLNALKPSYKFIRIRKNLGNAYRNHGLFDEAFDEYYKALQMAHQYGYIEQEATLSGEISTTYSYLNKLNYAVEYLEKSIQLYEQLKTLDSTALWISYQKLANIFLRQNKAKQALYLFENHVRKLEKTHRADAYYFALANLAPYLVNLGYAHSALDTIRKADQGLFSLKHDYNFPFVYSKYGDVYNELGNSDSALYYYKKSIAGLETFSKGYSLGLLLNYLDFLKENGLTQELDVYLEYALANLSLDNFPPSDVYKFIFHYAEYLFRNNNSREAYTMLKQNVENMGLQKAEDNEYVLNALFKKYEIEQLEAENKLLESKASAIQKRNIYLLIISAVALMASFYWSRNKNLKAQLLALEKKQLEEKFEIQEKKLHAHQEELLHIENKNLIMYEKLTKEHGPIEKNDLQDPMDWEAAQSPLLKSILRRAYVSDLAWFDNIRKQGDKLTENDVEFCLLIRLGMSNKEIAQLLNITRESVYTRKYRLAKKLGIQDKDDFNKWLVKLSETKLH